MDKFIDNYENNNNDNNNNEIRMIVNIDINDINKDIYFLIIIKIFLIKKSIYLN